MLKIVLGICCCFISLGIAQEKIVCYSTNWSGYRVGIAKFTPEIINPNLCSHLIYAFGKLENDTIAPWDEYQDVQLNGWINFNNVKMENSDLKTLIAINEPMENASRYSSLVADAERRKIFVENTLRFIKDNNFDGVDLVWQYPGRPNGSPNDKDNYLKLVDELRTAFDKDSSARNGQPLLITMAIPSEIDYAEKGYNISRLTHIVDWFNVLSYDYHKSDEKFVNHHAPLYSIDQNASDTLNINYTVNYYLQAGANRDKLVVGVPTYGVSFTLNDTSKTGIGSPASGPGTAGAFTRGPGILAYYEICQATQNDPDWKIINDHPNAVGPHTFKGDQWVAFDDQEIVKRKAEYVADNGLGGLMFWTLDNDDIRGVCEGMPFLLIDTAKQRLLDKISVGNDRPFQPTIVRAPPVVMLTTTTTMAPTTVATARHVDSNERSDFKCADEGIFPHKDCKKFYFCVDSEEENIGIVAQEIDCPDGLFFNPFEDACNLNTKDFCQDFSSSEETIEVESTPTTKAPLNTLTEKATSGSSQADADTITKLLQLINEFGGIENIEQMLRNTKQDLSPTTSTTTELPEPITRSITRTVPLIHGPKPVTAIPISQPISVTVPIPNSQPISVPIPISQPISVVQVNTPRTRGTNLETQTDPKIITAEDEKDFENFKKSFDVNRFTLNAKVNIAGLTRGIGANKDGGNRNEVVSNDHIYQFKEVRFGYDDDDSGEEAESRSKNEDKSLGNTKYNSRYRHPFIIFMPLQVINKIY